MSVGSCNYWFEKCKKAAKEADEASEVIGLRNIETSTTERTKTLMAAYNKYGKSMAAWVEASHELGLCYPKMEVPAEERVTPTPGKPLPLPTIKPS